jgi:hypothetical protein
MDVENSINLANLQIILSIFLFEVLGHELKALSHSTSPFLVIFFSR